MMKFTLIILTAMQLVIPVLAFAHGDQYGMGSGMMGWNHSMGWPMMIFMFLLWAAVLAGVIAVIRLIFAKGGHGNEQTSESALDILKKRFARGEIDQAEFEEKKRAIGE